ncbi:anoctamin-9 isoform X1 [Oryzias melastigma]|uniref:anoctamin-9 isoform X1 n=1 Tax=Oryzias melastigma TaxID=30732 RepID=UPI000CF7F00D|nr:anoctamin-9 isoform X1 [Oryzias melastigma]
MCLCKIKWIFPPHVWASIELLELLGVVNENGSTSKLVPPGLTPLSCDFVLVGKRVHSLKQGDYIHELKKKKFRVKEIEDDNLIFYGLQAPNEIFYKYRHLSNDPNRDSSMYVVPLRIRLMIVHFILNHTKTESGESLRSLLNSNIFDAKFCLHEKKRQKQLKESWARWTACLKGQPITDIRDYFGEKVALYFLWLGWYTYLLVPPAVIGVIVFLYGLSFFNSSPLLKEVCNSEIVMCPLCDTGCKVWKLSDTCNYAKLTLLFDNEGTVFFAMVMAIWTTLFLEFWKRNRASYMCEWKVSDWNEDEEELILEIINDPECERKQFQHSYSHSFLILVCVAVMILVIIGLTTALVVIRVMVASILAQEHWEFMSHHSNIGAMMLGAFLHYIIITVMTKVNRIVAMKLSDKERTRSFSARENSFTVKMFTFQFFTYFTSLFYVAFFLGRVNGHPGEYVRLAGAWRLEECHPSGCLTDLFIQMTFIMVLKQIIGNVFEFAGPWLCRILKKKKVPKLQRKCQACYLKDDSDVGKSNEMCDYCKHRDWVKNHQLSEVDSFSLFNEFLEMVIQFSFTTIFVAAFPLAPLLALFNNVIEIRLDAIKMVTLERRMVPKKTNDIGVWINILEVIGVLAVIANGLVIGISSDFIPRLVYQYYYGPCATGNGTDTDCMAGYINNSLSIASLGDGKAKISPSQMVTSTGINVTSCSYKDYRDSDYNRTPQFWLILAVRFAFVILFEHVLLICRFIAARFIPSAPMEVKNAKLSNEFVRLKEKLKSFEEHPKVAHSLP